MDNNVRSIELVRAERERLIALQEREFLERDNPDRDLTPRRDAATAEAIGLTDTAMFNRRVVTLPEERRESERILPPGAVLGVAGGAYKMLRTQALRRLRELGANTLAVLSSSNGEGKTLSAINLAVAIAADPGHTALLVDLDLRNPSVHRRLGFEPEVGIEDCVENRRSLQDAMVKIVGYDRLTVLPARGRVEMSSELVATPRMAELVRELRERYLNRIIIFDLPPVLLADDALAFVPLVQAGLFVVAEGQTLRDDITRSMELLHHLPIIGTVLNRSDDSAGAYY
jgi:Mrp family chromosome partitioning ATPase